MQFTFSKLLNNINNIPKSVYLALTTKYKKSGRITQISGKTTFQI